MRSNLSTDESSATSIADTFGGADNQNSPQIFSHAYIADRHLLFGIMCRALWGTKAAAALFDLVGQHLGHKDERQCRRWASGESEPPQSILWMLMVSKEGFRVVRYIGGGSTWLPNLETELHIAALARHFRQELNGVMK